MAQLKRVPGWIKRTRVPTRTTLRLSHHYHGRLCFPIPTRSILCRQAPSPPPWVRPVPLTWEVAGAGRKPRGGELDFSKWDYSSSFRKAGAEFLRTELPSEDSICCSLVLAQAIGQCPETTCSQKSWVLLVYIGDGGHRAILLSNPDSLLAPATA